MFSTCPFVGPLPVLWIWYFKNKWTFFAEYRHKWSTGQTWRHVSENINKRENMLNVNIIIKLATLCCYRHDRFNFQGLRQLQVCRRFTIVFAMIACAIYFVNTNCRRTPVVQSVESPTIIYDLSWIGALAKCKLRLCTNVFIL